MSPWEALRKQHSTSELIALVIAEKQGNKEFVLFYEPGDSYGFRAEVGNPCKNVCLGESAGEFESGWWASPKSAVAALLLKLREAQK